MMIMWIALVDPNPSERHPIVGFQTKPSQADYQAAWALKSWHMLLKLSLYKLASSIPDWSNGADELSQAEY